MVTYVVHRVATDVAALATLASKSYKHFWTPLRANSSDIMYQKTKLKKRKKEVEEEDENEEVIFTPLWTNVCLWHMSACNH